MRILGDADTYQITRISKLSPCKSNREIGFDYALVIDSYTVTGMIRFTVPVIKEIARGAYGF